MSNNLTEDQLEILRNKAQSIGMSRREFLRLLTVGGISAIVAACTPTATPIPATPLPVTPSATATQMLPSATPTATPTTTVTPTPTLTPTITSTPTPKSLGAPKPATYAQLPRWRGFNLLEKFRNDIPRWNKSYNEWDLDFMVEWGFDFIRLPTDYHIWTASPSVYREQPLKEIDQVIGWARMRGIHVNLCLHRAPGYCVNTPKEPLDLWGDDSGSEEARQQFAEQWRMFAARYRGISPAELSFNLVNEPPDISEERYVSAVNPAIAAIREEDSNRLIIADGLNYGRRPVLELVPLKVAQSTRGYEPFLVTHYRASWVEGSEKYPIPTWPIPVMINQFLYGDWKSQFRSPLIFKGNFAENAQLSIKVQQVSSQAELSIKANGASIFQKLFQPGPGQGEWKESILRQEWNSYLGIYDKEFITTLPAGTSEIQFDVIKGDWLTFSEIRIKPFPSIPTNELVIKAEDPQWAVRQEPVIVDAHGNLLPASGQARYSRETLWKNYVEPWENFSVQNGIGVHVGEWGAHNLTPHTVVLAWMKDCLENWKRAGIGWALWNLRGDSFGVLDSGRTDVSYENYQGHKLDRKMLELLRQG